MEDGKSPFWDGLLGREGVADLLGIGVRKVDYLTKEGQLVPVRIGVRVLFDPAEIRGYIERLKREQRGEA